MQGLREYDNRARDEIDATAEPHTAGASQRIVVAYWPDKKTRIRTQ